MRLPAGLLLCLILLCPAAQAAPLEELNYEYYEVRLAPGLRVQAALDAATPIHVQGQPFYAYTRWNVQHDYRWWEEADGRCRITSVQVQLKTRIQFPRLHAVPVALRQRSERAMAALQAHELGHHAFGQRAARKIESLILLLPEQSSCVRLTQEVDARAARVIDEFSAQEREYDRQTEHGRTQGAYFDF